VVPDNMEALNWFRKHLDAEGSDLLRKLVRRFARVRNCRVYPPAARSPGSCVRLRTFAVPVPRQTAKAFEWTMSSFHHP
jgi:hypothetical protein